MGNFNFFKYEENNKLEDKTNIKEENKEDDYIIKLDKKEDSKEEILTDISVEDETLSILDIILLISKYKKSIFIPTFSIIFTIIILMIFTKNYPAEHPLQFFPKVYRAKTEYFLKDLTSSSGSGLSSALSGGLGSLASSFLGANPSSNKIDKNLIEKIYTSNDFLDKMIIKLKLREELEKKILKKKDKIEYDDILQLDLRDNIKQNLAFIEDEEDSSYVSVYFITDKDPKYAYLFLKYANELFFKEYNKFIQEKISSQLKFIEEQLNNSFDDMQDSITKLQEFQKETGMYDPSSQKDIIGVITSTMINTISSLEIEKSEYLSYLPYDSPQVKSVSSKLIAAKNQLSKIKSNYSIGGFKLSYDKQLENLPKYEELNRTLKLKTELYATFVAQYEQTKLKLKNDLPTIQLLNAPEIPEKYFKPKRKYILIIMSFASFFIFFFIAFLREFIEKIKSNPENQEKLNAILSYYRKREDKR